MANRFDPERVVDLDLDYYGILSLEKGSLPEYGTRENNEKIAAILERGWRKAARKVHPDKGGSESAFELVLHCHSVLSNPIYRAYYDSGGAVRPKQIGEAAHEVDLDTVGTYVEGSLADTVGHTLMLNVRERAAELGLSPAYRPKSKFEAYEWDFAIGEAGQGAARDGTPKVAIAIVEDAGDVFRLTSGEDVEDSLPFKIYLCIPRVAPRIRRTKDRLVRLDDGTEVTWQGSLRQAVYDDYELLSTTRQQDAEVYLQGDRFAADLAAFRDGTLVRRKVAAEVETNQIGWRTKEEVKQIDAAALRDIMKRKRWDLTPDARAADFLDRFSSTAGDAPAAGPQAPRDMP